MDYIKAQLSVMGELDMKKWNVRISIVRQKQMNFVKLLKGYKKGWVGISSDFKKVIVWGKTLDSAMQKAKTTDERIYYFPVGESYAHFVGYVKNKYSL